jgi:hypothetical protein
MVNEVKILPFPQVSKGEELGRGIYFNKWHRHIYMMTRSMW